MKETIMRTPLLLLAAAALTGCAWQASNVDQRFGSAVMTACARQVVDPAAAAKRRGPVDMDAVAANSAVDNYEKSFCAPPAPGNVFNIGIGAGTGTISR